MNTPGPYQHREGRTPHARYPSATPRPAAETDPNPFAVHGDPSRWNDERSNREEPSETRRAAWYRISDLHTHPGLTKVLVRGIDLQAHVMRRALAQPVKAAKAVRRRVAGTTPEAPRPAAAGPEGMGLS